MNFSQRITEERRLCILRVLAKDAGYRTNTAILQDALVALGLSASMDQVGTDAAWLEEQGLVTVEKVSDVRLVEITQRGLDVSKGLGTVPGVARPRPGE